MVRVKGVNGRWSFELVSDSAIFRRSTFPFRKPGPSGADPSVDPPPVLLAPVRVKLRPVPPVWSFAFVSLLVLKLRDPSPLGTCSYTSGHQVPADF